jgi:hypothetical protein
MGRSAYALIPAALVAKPAAEAVTKAPDWTIHAPDAAAPTTIAAVANADTMPTAQSDVIAFQTPPRFKPPVGAHALQLPYGEDPYSAQLIGT